MLKSNIKLKIIVILKILINKNYILSLPKVNWLQVKWKSVYMDKEYVYKGLQKKW